MNYRHHYHAGNFADVLKHAALVRLTRAMQRKEKGFLYVDTHAGRGGYDLAAAARGDSLERAPEWPDGIGRLWTRTRGELPEALADYVALVRDHDRALGNLEKSMPRFYPGSPRLMAMLARPQDRLALFEKQPDEAEALRREFSRTNRAKGAGVQTTDGYAGLRGQLPPPEKRALVLIDPPFETRDEFSKMAKAAGEGLARLPSAVIALWYPLTERARIDLFFDELLALKLPPAFALELTIAGPDHPAKLKGCGLVVINPPWQVDAELAAMNAWQVDALAQAPGGEASLRWLVREA